MSLKHQYDPFKHSSHFIQVQQICIGTRLKYEEDLQCRLKSLQNYCKISVFSESNLVSLSFRILIFWVRDFFIFETGFVELSSPLNYHHDIQILYILYIIKLQFVYIFDVINGGLLMSCFCKDLLAYEIGRSCPMSPCDKTAPSALAQLYHLFQLENLCLLIEILGSIVPIELIS
ncbi:hypothetical protein FF38_13585 [Lucilia cuprina]|uniref:Uncharacterized protein n=1 Tax=Lucilia cuprina TaxID=7375 RepID=A0A0L0BR39_LUCCU|nr:hypothetical protein FF38_13585 [Lucilia cuprina]